MDKLTLDELFTQRRYVIKIKNDTIDYDERPQLAESSRKVYVNTLLKIDKEVPISIKSSDTPDSYFLKFQKYLDDTKNIATKRNIMNTIIGYLGQLRTTEALQFMKPFYEKVKEINTITTEKNRKGELTEKQKANAIPQKKLQRLTNKDLKPLITEIQKIEDSDDIMPTDMSLYKYWVLLQTYMNVPMRNELATVKYGDYRRFKKFLSGKEDIGEYGKDNWVLMAKNQVHLIFNNYKTSDSYGLRHVVLPKKLFPFYQKYLGMSEKSVGDSFFDMTNGNLSLFMSRYSKRFFQKSLTPNLLRTIYYSGNFAESKGHFEAIKDVAHGASAQTIADNYIKDIPEDYRDVVKIPRSNVYQKKIK
jgi:hypothetical protein